MMTKEEIVALKSRVEAFCPKPASADQIHLHVLKALDALEEAHRKLDRVKALWEKWDEEADFAANEMDPRTAETLNRCVQQIGEILLGESTT